MAIPLTGIHHVSIVVTDGAKDGRATSPPPVERYEPGFMQVGNAASAEVRAK